MKPNGDIAPDRVGGMTTSRKLSDGMFPPRGMSPLRQAAEAGFSPAWKLVRAGGFPMMPRCLGPHPEGQREYVCGAVFSALCCWMATGVEKQRNCPGKWNCFKASMHACPIRPTATCPPAHSGAAYRSQAAWHEAPGLSEMRSGSMPARIPRSAQWLRPGRHPRRITPTKDKWLRWIETEPELLTCFMKNTPVEPSRLLFLMRATCLFARPAT